MEGGTPSRCGQHRRALSETHLRFPELDDILLDDVMVELNLDLIPPTPPSLLPRKSDMDGEGGRHRHRHSNSMDGYSSATSSEMESTGKKAVADDRLADLALLDPKRAKRILANRQSAARSKERKIRYTSELERKVHTLQTEATTLSAQITILQRDTTGLSCENKELKLKLEAMEQQAQLRDALNEALRNVLERLKIAAAQIPLNQGLSSLHYFAGQQSSLSSPDDTRLNGPSFQDFNGRV